MPPMPEDGIAPTDYDVAFLGGLTALRNNAALGPDYTLVTGHDARLGEPAFGISPARRKSGNPEDVDG